MCILKIWNMVLQALRTKGYDLNYYLKEKLELKLEDDKNLTGEQVENSRWRNRICKDLELARITAQPWSWRTLGKGNAEPRCLSALGKILFYLCPKSRWNHWYILKTEMRWHNQILSVTWYLKKSLWFSLSPLFILVQEDELNYRKNK